MEAKYGKREVKIPGRIDTGQQTGYTRTQRNKSYRSKTGDIVQTLQLSSKARGMYGGISYTVRYTGILHSSS